MDIGVPDRTKPSLVLNTGTVMVAPPVGVPQVRRLSGRLNSSQALAFHLYSMCTVFHLRFGVSAKTPAFGVPDAVGANAEKTAEQTLLMASQESNMNCLKI
jgi:hypothetical protein